MYQLVLTRSKRKELQGSIRVMRYVTVLYRTVNYIVGSQNTGNAAFPTFKFSGWVILHSTLRLEVKLKLLSIMLTAKEMFGTPTFQRYALLNIRRNFYKGCKFRISNNVLPNAANLTNVRVPKTPLILFKRLD